MPRFTPNRAGGRGDSGGLGLASLCLHDDRESQSFEDQTERNRDVVAGALVFALELTSQGSDDVQLLDALELEKRVRMRLVECGEEQDDEVASSSTSFLVDDTDDDLGSTHALIVERGECTVTGETVLSTSSFSSFRADVGVGVASETSASAFAYEVQLHTSGIMQIGWVTKDTPYTNEDGVGDSSDSYAFDGRRVRCVLDLTLNSADVRRLIARPGSLTRASRFARSLVRSFARSLVRSFVRKWNGQSIPYGSHWTAGDVIGCAVDFDAGEVRYYRNGKDMGVAFDGISLEHAQLFPAVSLSYGECCEINLGRTRFQYDYGVEPVVRPSRGTERLIPVAKYVFDSLERLTIVGQARDRSSPRATAAMAVAQAEEYFGLDEGDDEERLAYRRSLKEPSPCDVLMIRAQEDAARVLFRLADACFRDEYLVDSLLMEACCRMNGYDYSGHALFRFLDLVAKGIGEDASLLGAVARVACNHAARRVMGNIWRTGEDPEYCPAIVASFIWQGFMKTPSFARAWVRRDGWEAEFERFFFVRQPTNKDMSELVPTSADTRDGEGGDGDGDGDGKGGGDEIEHVINTLVYAGDTELPGHGDDSGLVGIVRDVNRFLQMTDDVHAILLEQLIEIQDVFDEDRVTSAAGELDEADQDCDGGVRQDAATPISDASSASNPSDVDDFLEYFRDSQVTSLPRDQWLKCVLDVIGFDDDPARGMPDKKPPPKLLRKFLQFVTKKNMDVNREVVPPGASDRSVVCSLLSFMVRASRRFLRDVHLEGSSFEFPMQVFLRGMRSAVEGRSDLGDSLAIDARLGGGVAYLCKGSIVAACEKSRTPLVVPALDHDHASDWSIPTEMRPRAVFVEGTPEWSWWILDQCFVLFHLGGSRAIKRITAFMSTFEAAMGSYKAFEEKLEEMDRVGGGAGEEAEGGEEVEGGYGGRLGTPRDYDRALIELSMKECRLTMLTSLRNLMWHLNWLMPRWKQQTYAVLAGTMARVLLAMQREKDAPQVAYVAEFYLEGILDMVLACRGREMTAFAFEGDCLGCFETLVDLCVGYLADERVVSPRAESSILSSAWMLLRDEDTSYMLSRCGSTRSLLAELVSQFGNSRNWVLASNCFHLLVQHNGLAQRLDMVVETPGLAWNRVAIQEDLKRALAADDDLAARLCSLLIDRLNWVSPELVTILEELHQVVQNHRSGDMFIEGASLSYRRAAAACDLAYHLARLLVGIEIDRRADACPDSLTRAARFVRSFARN